MVIKDFEDMKDDNDIKDFDLLILEDLRLLCSPLLPVLLQSLNLYCIKLYHHQYHQYHDHDDDHHQYHQS